METTNMATNLDPRHGGTFGSSGSSSPHALRNALLWIVLILAFLVLSIARPLLGDQFREKATRTETVNASGTLRSLTVKGVNGEVEVAAGPSFSATVVLTARAETKERAARLLSETKVVFENEKGDLFLVAKDPGSQIVVIDGKKRLQTHRTGSEKGRIEARYQVTLPPGVALDVSTVNGQVVTKGIAAAQELKTVNGKIDVSGARRGLMLKTVNGAIQAACAELPGDAGVDAETVNGDVIVVLPAAAGFRLSAKTMNGMISSTFALPSRTAAGEGEKEMRVAVSEVDRDRARVERDRARAERDRARAERKKAQPDRRSDVGDLGELDESMEELSREMEKLGGEMGRMGEEIARSVKVNLHRSYEATFGSGGAKVRCSTLNGKVTVLADGTKAADAKDLLPHERVLMVQVPDVHVRVPKVVVVPPVPPVPPGRHVKVIRIGGDEEETRIGDVEGDYTSTAPAGDIVVGRVSGFAKIRSRAGQITLREAAKGASLSASGGDVKVESVGGDLDARTLGGNVTVGSVVGAAKVETMGGDITVRSVGGALQARTAGGDIVVRKASGSVNAETLGGTIVCEVGGKGGSPVELVSGGGDVTLTLPAGARVDVEIQVNGADSERQIRSDFPEVTVVRRAATLRGEGKLNGGGPKVVIQATSGTVTLKRGS
jgi:DUF4097 and DUF4098 domain-containing protein YvlB